MTFSLFGATIAASENATVYEPSDIEYLTTEEAARLLNVHVNTIVRWIKNDKLSA